MPSFLKIAPDLKKRVIILRSATKALSAAGERMAILLVFDPEVMNELLNKNINYFIHVPRSAQIAYAETMATFDYEEQQRLAVYYERKVEYVLSRLKTMGANMPDPMYRVEATFYALGDFSDLFGLPMPEESQEVFQKIGLVKTDEDLAYYLLYCDAVMIAPLSYFGLAKDSGCIRITCSASESDLKEMMDRLENRLIYARQLKKNQLINFIEDSLISIKEKDNHLYELIFNKLSSCRHNELQSLQLKKQLEFLDELKAFLIDGIKIIN